MSKWPENAWPWFPMPLSVLHIWLFRWCCALKHCISETGSWHVNVLGNTYIPTGLNHKDFIMRIQILKKRNEEREKWISNKQTIKQMWMPWHSISMKVNVEAISTTLFFCQGFIQYVLQWISDKTGHKSVLPFKNKSNKSLKKNAGNFHMKIVRINTY